MSATGLVKDHAQRFLVRINDVVDEPLARGRMDHQEYNRPLRPIVQRCFPTNLFVARFIGSPPINVLAASLAEGGTQLAVGPAQLPLRALANAAVLRAPDSGRSLSLAIRPEDISLADGEEPSRLPARIAVLELQGETTLVIADTSVGRVSLVVPTADSPTVDESVLVALNPKRAHVFAESGVAPLHGLSGT